MACVYKINGQIFRTKAELDNYLASKYGNNTGEVLGRMHDSMISLVSRGDLSSVAVARHEAMHYIVEHMLPNTLKAKLFKEAAEKMGDNPTYRDIHEYLADMFMDRKYETFSDKSQVRGFLQTLNDVSDNFVNSIGTINDLMVFADMGAFKYGETYNPVGESFDYQVKNEYTSNINYIQKAHRLFGEGNFGLIKHYAKVHFTSPAITNYYTANKVLLNPSMGITKSVAMAVERAIRADMMVQETDKSKNPTGKYRIYKNSESITYHTRNSETNKLETVSVKYGDIRKGDAKEHFINAIKYKGIDGEIMTKNDKFIRRYFLNSLLGDTTDFDAKFLSFVIQMALPGLDLEILHKDDDENKAQVHVVVRNDKMDNASKNPLGSRSQVYNVIFDSIPLVNSSGYKKKINNVDVFVSGKYLNDLLMRATVSLKRRNKEFSFDELEKEMESMKETEGVYTQSVIDSFLYYAGSKKTKFPATKNKKLIIVKQGMNGYLKDTEVEKLAAENKVVANKLIEYRDFINGLISYYESIYNQVTSSMNIKDNNGKLIIDENIINKVEGTILKKDARNTLKNRVSNNFILSNTTIKYANNAISKLESNIDLDSRYKVYSSIIKQLGGVYYSADVYKDAETKIGKENLFNKVYAFASYMKFIADNQDYFKDFNKRFWDKKSILSKYKKLSEEEQAEYINENGVPELVPSLNSEIKSNILLEGRKKYLTYLKKAKLNNKSQGILSQEVFHPFFDSLYESHEKTIDMSTDSMIRSVNGQLKYTKPLSSFFFDTIFSGYKGDEASSNIRSYVIDRIKRSGNKHSILHKGNEYFNPILNKKINLESVYVFDGVKYLKGTNINGIRNRDMSSRDKFFVIKQLMVKNAYSQNSNSLYAFNDTLSDKTTLPMYKFEINKNDSDRFDWVLTNVDGVFTVNKRAISNLMRDHLKYDANEYDIIKNEWEKLAGKKKKVSKVDDPDLFKLITYELQKGKHYVLNDDVVSLKPKENHFSLKELNNISDDKLYNKLRELYKEDYLATVMIMKDSGVFNKFNKSEIGAQNQKREELLNNNLIDENGNWNAIVESMFWSHMIINKSISTLVRGSKNESKDVTDWIKRAAGLIAPGTVYYNADTKAWFGKGLRTSIVKDVSAFNKFYRNEKLKEAMDGAVILNPITQALMIKATGGKFSAVTRASLKNVYYNYNINTNNLDYIKFNHFPINPDTLKNNDFYQDLLNMMLGENTVIKNMYDDMIENQNMSFEDTVDAIAEFLISEDGEEYRDTMVDQLAFESAYKQGKRRVNEWAEGSTVKNLRVPIEWNSEDKVVYNDIDGLRMQQITYQDPINGKTSIPIQIMRITGSRSVNEALSKFSSLLREELKTKKGRTKWLNNSLVKFALRSQTFDKASEIMLNRNIAKDVILKKTIQALGSMVSQDMKGSLPGSYHIQAPQIGNNIDLKTIGYNILERDENGKVISQTPIKSREELKKYLNDPELKKKLRLQKTEVVMTFNHANVFGIEKNTTLEDAMTIYDHKGNAHNMNMEDGYFTYKDIMDNVNSLFTKNLSLSDLDKIIQNDGVREKIIKKVKSLEKKNLNITKEYQDAIKSRAQEIKARYLKDSPERKSSFKAMGIDSPGKAKASEKAAVYEKRAKYEFMLESKGDDISFEDYIAKKEKSDEAIDVTSKTKENNRIRQAMTEYYYNFNEALNVYFVRLPTTDASMGSPARIKAFNWYSGNTIYTNSEKNILDGSDYDADQVNVFYQAFDPSGNLIGRTSKALTPEDYKSIKEKNKGKKIDFNSMPRAKQLAYQHSLYNQTEISQNKLYKGLIKYYENPDNSDNVFSLIDLKSFEDAAEKSNANKTENNFYYNMGVSIKNQEINYDGVDLVGHGANVTSAMFIFNGIYNQINKQKHSNEKLKKVFNKGLFTKYDKKTFLEVINFTMKFTNAATDNAKLGGILGQLNINKFTSPIIAGILYDGGLHPDLKKQLNLNEDASIEDQILTLLQDERLINYSTSLKALNNMENMFNPSFYTKRNGAKKNLKNWYKYVKGYVDTGNLIRSMDVFNKLYNGIESVDEKYERLIYNVERSLGMRMKDFLPKAYLALKGEKVSWPSPNEQISFIKNELGTTMEGNAETIQLDARSSFSLHDVLSSQSNIVNQINLLNNFDLMLRENSIVKNANVNGVKAIEHYKKHIIGNGYALSEEDTKTFNEALEDVHTAHFISSMKKFKNFNKVYDFSKMEDREEFVRTFPNKVNKWKNTPQFKGNRFLKGLGIREMRDDAFSYVEFKKSVTIDNTAEEDFREDFQILPKEIKEAFQVYQLLKNGFRYASGTFSNIMDNEMEKKYTDFYRENKISNEQMEQYLIDIAIRTQVGFSDYDHVDKLKMEYADELKGTERPHPQDIYGNFKKYKPIGYKSQGKGFRVALLKKYRLYGDVYYNGRRDFDVSTPIVLVQDKDGNNLQYAQLSSHKYINPYIENGSYYKELNFKFANRLDLANIENDNELLLPPKGEWNGFVEERNPFNLNSPLSGDRVRLVNGKLASVTKESKGARINIINRHGKESRMRKERMGSGVIVLNKLIRKIEKAFPNIKINVIDNPDAEIGSVHQGEVYLNASKIQYDTPIHELAHIFVMMLKKTNSKAYSNLSTQASKFLDANPDLKNKLMKEYSELNNSQLLEEAIVTIIGWNSEEDVKSFIQYYKAKAESPETIWEKVSRYIKEAINAVKRKLTALFGANKETLDNVDLSEISIGKLSQLLVDAVLQGKPVSNISSTEIAQIQGITRESKINTSPKSIRDIVDNLSEGNVNYNNRIDREIIQLKERIYNNEGRVPADYGYDKEKINPKNVDELKAVIDHKEKINKELPNKIVSLLSKENHISSDPEKSGIKVFGMFHREYKGDDVPVYTGSKIEMVWKALRYDSTSEFMTYSDMALHPEYNVYFDKAFEGYNPVIRISKMANGEMSMGIYNISSTPLNDVESKNETASLYENYATKEEIRAAKLQTTNTEKNKRILAIGLLRNYLNQKGVNVREMGLIEMNPAIFRYHPVDQTQLNGDISKVRSLSKIKKEFPKAILEVMEDKYNYTSDINYLQILAETYRSAPTGTFQNSMHKYWVSNQMDNLKMLDLLRRRLLHLQHINGRDNEGGTINQESYNEYELSELDLLQKAIGQLQFFNQKTMNKVRSMSNLKMYMQDSGAIGNEYAEKAIKQIHNSNRKIVRKYNNYMDPLKNKTNGAFRALMKLSGKIGESYISDVSEDVFKKLIVFENDIDGNKYNTGHIYWTTDEKEDPLFAKKAKELLKNDPEFEKYLVEGRKIVKVMDNVILDLIRHKLKMRNFERENNHEGFSFGYSEDIVSAEYNKSGYKSGMIPVIPTTLENTISRGIKFRKTKNLRKKAWQKMSALSYVEEDYDENQFDNTESVFKMNDMFTSQFGLVDNTNHIKYTWKRLNSLGLTEKIDSQGNQILVVNQPDKNQDITMDLEKALSSFVMSATRVMEHESVTLPYVNAIRTLLMADEINRGAKNDKEQKFIDKYLNITVRGRRAKLDAPLLGFDTDKISQVAMKAFGASVMIGNVNIGVLSAMVNNYNSMVEAGTNSIMELFGFKSPYFTLSDFTKANMKFVTDFRKVMELALKYNIYNATDYEQINHRTHQITKNYLISDFYVNIANWSTDLHSRVVTMVAQMIHDGSYDAHTFNKKTGKLEYDILKDKRFSENGKTLTEKGKALAKHKRILLMEQGSQTKKDDKTIDGVIVPVLGYEDNEAGTMKYLSDRYIMGTYDSESKGIWGAVVAGQMLTFLRNFAMVRITNALKTGEYVDKGGRWVVKDTLVNDPLTNEKRYLVEWEKIWLEGYVNTALNLIVDTVKSRNINEYKNLNYMQKRNLVKFATMAVSYASLMAIYGVLFAKDWNEYEKDDSKIAPLRIFKNAEYALDSIFMYQILSDFIQSPFILFNIAGNIFHDSYGNFDWSRPPFLSQYRTFSEMPLMFKDRNQLLDNWDEEKRRRAEKARRVREENEIVRMKENKNK